MLFEKGTSGNPAGKPKGCRNKNSELKRQLDEHAPQIVSKLIQLAQDGDVRAIKLCIERTIPIAKPETFLDIPKTEGLKPLEKILTVSDSLIDQVSEGEVAVETATPVAKLLETHRKIIETADHEVRLADIESKLA